METFTDVDSVEVDLAKCRSKQGNRPIWVLAEENNEKPKVVNVKQVGELAYFLGC